MKTITAAVQSFTNSLSVGKARNTVEAYQVALDQFAQMWPASFTVDQLNTSHVEAFAQTIKDKAPATIQNYLTAVARFYKFLLRNRWSAMDSTDYAQLDETIKSLRPRFTRLPHPVDDVTINALLAEIKRTPLSTHISEEDQTRHTLRILRDTTIVLTLQVSGMRIGELVCLRREDVDWGSHSARVTGKGNKERLAFFNDAAWHALEEYLAQRHDGATGRALGSLPLFARHDRRAGPIPRPLTTKSVELRFAELIERCRLLVRVTPHTLRHSFATKMLGATGDLALVQEALGHASPATTRVYASVSPKKIRAAVNEVFES